MPKIFDPCPAPSTTPWGDPYSPREIAPGIWSLQTPSHGGIFLSRQRWEGMPLALARVPTFAGGPWYEEDSDIALVILAYPDLFDPRLVWECYRAMERWSKLPQRYPNHQDIWFCWQGPERDRARRIAHDWADTHGDGWLMGGGCTKGGGWHIDFRRVRDGHRTTRYLPSEDYYRLPPWSPELPGEPVPERYQ